MMEEMTDVRRERRNARGEAKRRKGGKGRKRKIIEGKKDFSTEGALKKVALVKNRADGSCGELFLSC